MIQNSSDLSDSNASHDLGNSPSYLTLVHHSIHTFLSKMIFGFFSPIYFYFLCLSINS